VCAVKLLDGGGAIVVVDSYAVGFADSVGVFAANEREIAPIVFWQHIVVVLGWDLFSLVHIDSGWNVPILGLSFGFDESFDACDDDANGGMIGDGFDRFFDGGGAAFF
jgi:hypothetical protein